MIPYQNIYILNHIKINLAKKNFKFSIRFTKRLLELVRLLANFGIISHFKLKKEKLFYKIIIYLNYNVTLNFYKTIKLISKPSHSFYITTQMLNLLKQRTGASMYIMFIDNKYYTHVQALKLHKGGKLVYFIC
uniref:Ribosomal protein S8 n=1 Tax=Pseudourostyla cristata TaxID=293816 RepID=A0A4P9JLB8_9SPIT|nr:ribosomal protein S8 [Pseudourostyla cristata]